MTPEYREKFRRAALIDFVRSQAIRLAWEGWDAIEACHEKRLLSELHGSDLIVAVWLLATGEFDFLVLRGPETITKLVELFPTGGAEMRAIPVADEQEALRLKQLFAGAIARQRR